MNTNNYIIKAKENKKDEFYTSYETIEKEVNEYLRDNKDLFRDKVVFCPCDSEESNFYKFFKSNFKLLGLKKLIATSYNPLGNGTKIELTSKESKTSLRGNGDFRSFEVQSIEADFIITNPPFSLFRPFMDWLFRSKKKFLVLGHLLACGYKDIYPKIVNNELWLGQSIHNGGAFFQVPDDYPLEAKEFKVKDSKKYINVKGVRWFTNIDYNRNNYNLELKTFEENSKTHTYIKYDNFDALEIPKTKLIPKDYEGLMGVPLSFLDKFNNKQFRIVLSNIWNQHLRVQNKQVFKRVIIQKI